VVLVGIAVAPAALVLSLVPPGVVKLRLRTLAETGQTVGRLSAVGTLGALAGTFLTGFVLLSALPTSQLLLVTGAVLVASGVAVALSLPRPRVPAAPLAGVVALSLLTGSGLLLADGTCQYETRYYCATVEVDPERPSGRILVLDGLRHSYVDLEDSAHLQFVYTQRIADVLAEQPAGPLDVLHLGLGGGSLPRHLAVVRPGSRSTALEVDPQLPAIGRDELGLEAVPDLEIVVADARTGIAELPDDSYDVVVGDAFGGRAVPWHLTTVEMVEQVRRVLRPGGFYALNVIDQPPLAFARAETATLLRSFEDVAVLAGPGVLAGEEGGNLVLVAGDLPVDLEALAERAAVRGESGGVAGREHAERFAGDAQVLTDDEAPVDQLLTGPSSS
jgi:spermidine synthase